MYAAHASGASSLDHVVVLTPDLERTSGSIAEATGHELRRVREVGSMRQGFHRIGDRGHGGLIVELVERPDIEPGPAAFWGIVLCARPRAGSADRASTVPPRARPAPEESGVRAGAWSSRVARRSSCSFSCCPCSADRCATFLRGDIGATSHHGCAHQRASSTEHDGLLRSRLAADCSAADCSARSHLR